MAHVEEVEPSSESPAATSTRAHASNPKRRIYTSEKPPFWHRGGATDAHQELTSIGRMLLLGLLGSTSSAEGGKRKRGMFSDDEDAPDDDNEGDYEITDWMKKASVPPLAEPDFSENSSSESDSEPDDLPDFRSMLVNPDEPLTSNSMIRLPPRKKRAVFADDQPIKHKVKRSSSRASRAQAPKASR